MKHAVIALFLIVGTAHLGWAQPLRGSSYETMLMIAKEKMEQQDYYNALEYYQKAFDDKEDESLLPFIAELNLKLRDYATAQRTYARVFRRDKAGKYEDLRFNYARALKMYGSLEESIVEFQQVVTNTLNDTIRELAKMEIAGAELALASANKKAKIEPERLDRAVNSPFSEYSAAYSREGNLYFSGFQTDEVITVDAENTDYFAKIYMSKKSDKGWGKPEPLPETINRPGVHTSNVSFSRDGNRMYFTRQVLQGNVVVDSRIYYSVGGDGAWGAAQEVVGISGDFRARHPAVGELFGREVLFFSSDMTGGYGGYDLYYAPLKSEGVYGDPVNLGPKLNTAGDEITPFYYDGTLYYSSTGLPTMGGFDVFYSVWNGQTWSEPLNMGMGINTGQDDQYFSLDNEGYQGLMTSNRPGGRSVMGRTCCDDIYGFAVPKITADLVVGVFDSDRKALKGATVMVIPTAFGDPQSQVSATGNRFDFPLELDKSYRIIATHPQYFPDSAQMNTVGLKESKSFEQRFYLKAKPLPPPEPEYDTITLQQAILLENILYDFNDAKIKPEAETDLNVVLELMTEYPDMVIELGSHTDNRGNDGFNQHLAQRRANSARTWLIERGVAPERIVAKGYGEEEPKTVTTTLAAKHPFLKEGDVLNKAYIDKLPTEEQQEVAHSINRRTEFKIIKGPTSITIKRTRLRKQDTKSAPNRNSSIQQEPRPVRQDSVQDSVKIHPLSSLRDRTDLTGLPIMDFTERTIDFGAVPKGEKREHVYTFTNRGDTPLVISIISACDCTTTEYLTDPVPPGGEGKIKVIFDSTEKDAPETIDIDIILENTLPDSGRPIIERIQYLFTIVG